MPRFKRAWQEGGTFFFTLVTNRWQRAFESPAHVALIRKAFAMVRRPWPFDLPAAKILPDHLHIIMELPEGNDDYSTRIGRIKVEFTRLLPAE